MSSSPEQKEMTQRPQFLPFAISLAVVLCVAACVLIVLIPTTSITVDSVYQGF